MELTGVSFPGFMEHVGLSVTVAQNSPFPLDVAFDCGPDDVLAVFGPSGSGKTTLLRCIAGLHRAARSHVVCNGEVWADSGTGLHVPTHRRRVGFVFQDYGLFPHLSALGNVMAALGGQAAGQRQTVASRWLAAVHLTGLESRRPDSLSGGQRQRVALARALARDPQVLLLDEPFGAIDRALRGRLHGALDEVRRQLRVPVLLVTHDFRDVVRLATHVLLLEGGRCPAAGPIEEVTSRADLPWERYGVSAGSVFDARVVSVDRARGLAELTSSAGTLLVPQAGLHADATVRVRVPTRDVILATCRPDGLSLHNILPAHVLEVGPPGHQVVVRLQAGTGQLLAEVTGDAVDRLQVRPGRPLFALVKSVSIEVHGPGDA